MSEGIWVPPGGSADPRRDEAMQSEARGEPTPEEFVEEFQRLKVSDLLVSTVYTLSQVGYAKLDPKTRDLEQARLAIDALSALVPVLRGAANPGLVRDFNQVVANMQLAYADAVESAGPGEAASEPGAAPAPERSGEEAPEEDLEAVDEEELGGEG
jgi:hypothetical protein